MKISFFELCFLLDEKYDLNVSASDISRDVTVSYPRSLEDDDNGRRFIVIAGAQGRNGDKSSQVDIPVTCSHDIVVRLYESAPKAQRRHNSREVYLDIAANDVNQVAADIIDSLLRLSSWEVELSRALLNGGHASDLMRIGQSMISELSIFADPDFKVIAMPPREPLGEKDFDSFWKKGRVRGESLPRERVQDVLRSGDYLASEEIRGTFVYPVDAVMPDYICGNVFANGVFSARLVAHYPAWRTPAARLGCVSLFSRFFEYVQRMYLNSEYEGEPEPVAVMHRLLRSILVDPDSVSYEQLVTASDLQGYGRDDKCVILRVRFFKGAWWADSVAYACRHLEDELGMTYAAAYGDDIIWFCNLTYLEISLDELRQHLLTLINELTCKIGMSCPVQGVANISIAVKEAEMALAIGEEAYPHLYYYTFEQCAVPYLLKQMTSEFPAQHLISSELQKLMAYDEENDTELLDTLRCFIECGCNAARAAEVLFLHRTSLARRIDKASEVAGVDFRNEPIRIDWILSFMLLDNMRVKG